MDQGVGIWDLTRSSVSFSRINLKISKFYTVTEEAQMRPDLICLQAYGNLTNIGSLMKINSYSNPFAISEGMLFAIPVQDRLDAAFDQKRKLLASILAKTTNAGRMGPIAPTALVICGVSEDIAR